MSHLHPAFRESGTLDGAPASPKGEGLFAERPACVLLIREAVNAAQLCSDLTCL